MPVKESSNFVLDGSQSRGAGPTDRLSFQWEQVSGPPAKPVSGQNTPRATYQAPDVNQSGVTLVFKLTAKNLRGAESEKTIPVQLSGANARPIANAGPDQTARENANVTLDGRRSSDPDRSRLTFSWVQVPGPVRVILSDDSTPVTKFKAPFVPKNNTVLAFRLTVKDAGGLNASDMVRVNIQKGTGGIVDNPPVANAGPDKVVLGNKNVTLDGSKSSDPDIRDKLSYQWRQIGGTPVVLADNNRANTSFISPDVQANTTLTFALTVFDPAHKNSTDAVKVIVIKPEGFAMWIVGVAGAAAAGGFAAWHFLFKKPTKPRLKFVP
jgi:hypothetical protein